MPSFLVVTALFFVIFASCLAYLRTTARLVERLEHHHADFWRDHLGAPRLRRHVRRRGLHIEIIWYLEPLLPFLRWVLAGSAGHLCAECAGLHGRARGLFLFVLLAMVVYAALFALLLT